MYQFLTGFKISICKQWMVLAAFIIYIQRLPHQIAQFCKYHWTGFQLLYVNSSFVIHWYHISWTGWKSYYYTINNCNLHDSRNTLVGGHVCFRKYFPIMLENLYTEICLVLFLHEMYVCIDNWKLPFSILICQCQSM